MDLKSFYLSEKNPDKLVNEGVMTMFSELEGVRSELRAMLKPNGSQQAPARSCYDLFLCNPSFDEGYYWIDPNIGNSVDAIQVYCSRPGCSCLDCEGPTDSDSLQQWQGVAGKTFTSAGHELSCPIPVDQLGLLRLLSAEARQVFTYYQSSSSSSSSVNIEFLGAEGDSFAAQQITKEKLGKTRTDFSMAGEPENFPLKDFVAEEEEFGFSLGRACFCNHQD